MDKETARSGGSRGKVSPGVLAVLAALGTAPAVPAAGGEIVSVEEMSSEDDMVLPIGSPPESLPRPASGPQAETRSATCRAWVSVLAAMAARQAARREPTQISDSGAAIHLLGSPGQPQRQ